MPVLEEWGGGYPHSYPPLAFPKELAAKGADAAISATNLSQNCTTASSPLYQFCTAHTHSWPFGSQLATTYLVFVKMLSSCKQPGNYCCHRSKQELLMKLLSRKLYVLFTARNESVSESKFNTNLQLKETTTAFWNYCNIKPSHTLKLYKIIVFLRCKYPTTISIKSLQRKNNSSNY